MIPLIGRWAVCKRGRLGMVLASERCGDDVLFTGVGLDGKPWQSYRARFLSVEESERLERLQLTAEVEGQV